MSSLQIILFGNDDLLVNDELVTNDELMGKHEKIKGLVRWVAFRMRGLECGGVNGSG